MLKAGTKVVFTATGQTAVVSKRRPGNKTTAWIHCNGDEVMAWLHELEIVDESSALDIQIDGNHYKNLAIQPVEYILANKLPFCEGNVVKYITRWRSKGGVKDLEKAKHFIDLIIQNEVKNEQTN